MVSQEWPSFRAVVRRFGTNKQAAFSLLRQVLSITATDAIALMRGSDLEVASGEEREVKRIAQCFRDVGATVKIELIGSPPAVSLDQALESPACYFRPVPAAIEGLLVVAGETAYLVADEQARRGVFLLGPRIDRRLEKAGASFPIGGLITYRGTARVEGRVFRADMPMFPVCIMPLVVTYYGERFTASGAGQPIRIECY